MAPSQILSETPREPLAKGINDAKIDALKKVNGQQSQGAIDIIRDIKTPKELGINVSNDSEEDPYADRAQETAELIKAVSNLLIPFIANADKVRAQDPADSLEEAPDSIERDTLVRTYSPKELIRRLAFSLPEDGLGQSGLVDILGRILKYSVNTWHQGFMHKLYATTNPIGVASELILAVLNTNLHVYKVSPALTVIERITAAKLANTFGFTGPFAGGNTHPGGSASNLTAMIIARNTYFPNIRTDGNNGRGLVVFTSEACHYSITKAAQTLGIGSKCVWSVSTDEQGRMRVDVLKELLNKARVKGLKPFFINATAGTTVLGACDPLHEIADICAKEDMWMHVDASWGGAAIFSEKYRYKLRGIERARSITTNPHKMLGVPVTCSFLLGYDMRVFWHANRIDARYLFHESVDEENEVSWDLADSTLQCGRKGDSLKLALSWLYYGRSGLAKYVENGFETAQYLAELVQDHPDLILASTFPPPCLQVCFYHQPDGSGIMSATPEESSAHTKMICDALFKQGFMIDFAPGPHGNFIRVVVNGATTKATMQRLVNAVLTVA